jgi:hypothetical protein
VRKLATLKQFALLIAVNPFVIGCGKRGGKTKSSGNVKNLEHNNK